MRIVRRTLILVVVATLVPTAMWSRPASASASASTPPSRWIAVSVASLWASPRMTRPVDRPSTRVPADPRAWVAAMTVAQKRWLVGRLETQALYGTRVRLLATSNGWSKVAVASQPSPKSRWGYPGWLPTAQLTATAPVAAAQTAVIRHRTAWLWSDGASVGTPDDRLFEVSYDTRLPVAVDTPSFVEVVLLNGDHAFLSRDAVAVHADGVRWPAVRGSRLVTEAKRFLGLAYLWSGTAGFGYDCSGLVHSVYHALGVTIPRDADAQFARGTRIATRSGLRPGDLVFFRDSSGFIHHVGMYVGNGRMIHSPATGMTVRITSMNDAPYSWEFAGGRRYTG